jgi:hypothetical protein
VTAPAAAKHVCWSFDDRRELEICARAFLASGLAAGEQVWYSAPGGPGGLTGWLEEAARRNPGAVQFVPIESAYPSGAVFDPPAQVAAYARATEAALDAGYTGLCVVADGTSMVRTPAQLSVFARYESLVTRFIADAPMRAVCGFDRGELGDRPVAELACLHPVSNVTEVRFTLRGGPPGGAGILAGELDLAADDIFPAALAHVRPQPIDGNIVFDASGLRFVDHRSLLHLQRYAEALEGTVVLRTALGTAAKITGLLGLDRVRVEGAR